MHSAPRLLSMIPLLASLGACEQPTPVRPERAVAATAESLLVDGPGGRYRLERVMSSRLVAAGNGLSLQGDWLYLNQAALDAILAIHVNDKTLRYVASETDADAEELVTPDDHWRDPVTGDLYVTEILTNGVRRVSPSGERFRVSTGFADGTAHPNAITGLRRPGQPLRLFLSMLLFQADAQTGIWELDPAGVVPPRLVYGAASNQVIYGHGMRAPNAMAFDPAGSELFVPETYGGKVWAIDVDAHTARLVYSGRDERANGIAVRFARNGTLLYAEQDSGRLLRLDPNGAPNQVPQLIAQVDPGIDGIAEHPDGRIFLSNFRYGGITVVHPDGRTEQLFPRSLALPNAVTPLADGRLAIADLGSLALVDPMSGAGSLSRPKQFIRDDFDVTTGVAALGACDVYATAFFRGTLQHVDVCNPGSPHREIVPRRTFVTGWDVVAHGAELFVTESSGAVWRISGVSGGAPAQATPLASAFANPTGIAASNGRLYVSESAADQVRVLDVATGLTIRVMTGLAEPEGVAVDRDGSLLVVEARAGRLTRVLPDGTRRVVLEGLSTDIRGVSVVPTINFFADVAVTANGEIFITSPREGSLLRLVPLP